MDFGSGISSDSSRSVWFRNPGCLPQVLFHGDCAGVWDIAECLYVVWDFASSKAVFGTEVSRLGQWAEAWY